MIMLIKLPQPLEKSRKFKKTNFHKLIPSKNCCSFYELNKGPNTISSMKLAYCSSLSTSYATYEVNKTIHWEHQRNYYEYFGILISFYIHINVHFTSNWHHTAFFI